MVDRINEVDWLGAERSSSMAPGAVHAAAAGPIRRLAVLVLSLLVLSGCGEEPSVVAPASKEVLTGEMKAFRSVLDGKPRILTLHLGNDVRLAYDTESANLYRLWRGEVDLKGAVFDTRHGPQPTSEGALYATQPEAQWQLEGAEWRYAGHRFEGRQPVLLYEGRGNDWTAYVSETPRIERQGDTVTLRREFLVHGLPDDVDLVLSGQVWPEEKTLKGAAQWSGEKGLRLSNGASTLTLTYTDPEPIEAEEVIDPDQHAGEALVANSDCAACHNPQAQTVGPAYIDIAQRYDNRLEVVIELAQKIIEGGAGNWGQTPMTPHPDLSEEDAEQMVGYIFSLGGKDPEETRWLLDQPADAYEVVEDPSSAAKNGAMLYLHPYSGDQPSIDTLRTSDPVDAARVARIHLPNKAAFAPLTTRFAMHVKAHLRVELPLETELRLVSDDGGFLYLDGEPLIDNWGFHGPQPAEADVALSPGLYPLDLFYFQSSKGAALSLQWRNPQTGEFEIIPDSMLRIEPADRLAVRSLVTDPERVKAIPGDQYKVPGMHPAFDVHQARPEAFEPMVGGIDFLPDGRMVISTWDPEGSVYIVSDYTEEPDQIEVKRIARGLAEPLGVKVVDGEIYVLQKQELTHLEDLNGDEVTDVYRTVSADWAVTDNFHEFSFGLEYEDGHFYGALATAILAGGASAQPQAPDRGKALKIRASDGQVTYVAHGLRTPNGIGYGIDEQLFIADNQGDWLPASKIVELTPGAWYGSRSVDYEGTADLTETQPVVWLPQDEIGNSPSEPAPLNVGPYQNQMIHGDVTHGGIKRVYAERVNGRLQGAVFRFMQGLEAGVNRLDWTPDGSLIVGGVGNPGNWADGRKQWYGLQRLKYNGETAFEMLSISARSDGFVIEFTQPIKAGQHLRPDDFQIQQWYYEPTEDYGGPKKKLETLPIEGFALSEDRTQARFKLDGLKPEHVVYFRIKRPFVSDTGNSLWSTEAWYTLNAIPDNKPVTLEGRTPEHNTLTDTEKVEGWRLLFDGESLNGLRNYNAQTLGKRWTVDNGTLHFQGRGTEENTGWQSEHGGDLVLTPKPVKDFELYLEWKLSQNGNSGILYSVDEGHEHAYMSGPEYQLLDNIGHPDSEIYTHRAGDLYDLIAGQPVTVNPPGEWNRTRLVVNDGHIEHWLNGYRLVNIQMGSDVWNALIANSKFAEWDAFAATPQGHIVLQDHGDAVWFRNIKMRELN
ncbi:family 16 glycoside hydrolase [Marinimicrobium locisalis]|uniref:family 16 glycoside hydrolase n=1 Tax=Marinimicrobium locisalis TaxID=546022 RepID=UPI003221CD4D